MGQPRPIALRHLAVLNVKAAGDSNGVAHTSLPLRSRFVARGVDINRGPQIPSTDDDSCRAESWQEAESPQAAIPPQTSPAGLHGDKAPDHSSGHNTPHRHRNEPARQRLKAKATLVGPGRVEAVDRELARASMLGVASSVAVSSAMRALGTHIDGLVGQEAAAGLGPWQFELRLHEFGFEASTLVIRLSSTLLLLRFLCDTHTDFQIISKSWLDLQLQLEAVLPGTTQVDIRMQWCT